MKSILANKCLLFIDKLLSYHVISVYLSIDILFSTSLITIDENTDDTNVRNLVLTFNNGKKTYNYNINPNFCNYTYDEQKYEVIEETININTTDASYHLEDILTRPLFVRILNIYVAGVDGIKITMLKEKINEI